MIRFNSTSGTIVVKQYGQGSVDLNVDATRLAVSDLAGYEASRFVSHEEVVLAAGEGLSGGGRMVAGETTLRIDTRWLHHWIEKNPPSHAALRGTSDHEHVNHTKAGIGAGDGLSGGGDLTQWRVLSLDAESMPKVTSLKGQDWLILWNEEDGFRRLSASAFLVSLKQIG